MPPPSNHIPPPAYPAEGLPLLRLDGLEACWRVHEEVDVLDPEKHPSGKWRFDSPASLFQVAYFNYDEHAVFAEVYGDRKEIPPDHVDRYYSEGSATRELKLVALEDAQVLAAFGLTINISASIDYARTMAWSQAFHDWYDDADGIRYLGRHAATYLNYCLFLDRCAADLDVSPRGQLGGLRPTVMKACDLYNIAPRLFDSRAGTGWP